MMRIAALASHGGSILQAVIDACFAGNLDASVVAIICNNSGAEVFERARAARIPAFHLSSITHTDPTDLDRIICSTLDEQEPDWILLCGYMKKLGPLVLGKYKSRIVNTHPALLPKYGGQGFYGRRIHQAVLSAGELESGATVHLVDSDYDTGPILAQAKILINAEETVMSLEQRIKTLERRLIVQTLRELSANKSASSAV